MNNTVDWKEWILSFITLRLPKTTSWYFKIQILFYILLFLSEKIKERQVYFISIFVIVYAGISKYSGMADYWWKTSLCFVIGCVIAKYKNLIILIIKEMWFKMIVNAAGCLALVYTRIDFKYILIPQLLAYVFIAVFIVYMWDWLIRGNIILQKIGKVSLPMYLVHIGIVDSIFGMSFDINAKVIIFVVVITVGTVVCYLISEYIYKIISSKVKKE